MNNLSSGHHWNFILSGVSASLSNLLPAYIRRGLLRQEPLA